MPSLTPLKSLGAILARAKSLVAGGKRLSTVTRVDGPPSAPDSEVDAGNDWELGKQDKSFWVTMAGADRRLAELRRAIDQAAAEASARESGGEAPPTDDPDPSFGESRCAKANRLITDALGRGDLDPAIDRMN